MDRLRQRLLKLAAGAAVWAAVLSLCIAMQAFYDILILYARAIVWVVPLSCAALLSAVFWAGFFLNAGLMKTNRGLRAVALRLAGPNGAERAGLWLARGIRLFAVVPVVFFAFFTGASVGESVYRIVWALVFYLLSVRAGSCAYDEILSPAVSWGCVISLGISAALGLIVSITGDASFLSVLPWFALFFALCAVPVYNQAGIDEALFSRKRVSSALPRHIRRNNLFLILGISAVTGVLFLLRDAIGAAVQGVLWLFGQAAKLLFSLWYRLTPEFVSTGQLILGEDDGPPALPDDASSPFLANALFFLAALAVTLLVLWKVVIPGVRRGLGALIRKIREFHVFKRTRIPDGDSGFTDAYEELRADGEWRPFRPRRAREPDLSGLSKIKDPSERVRFLYKLSLFTLTRKQRIRPSDTTGMILERTSDPRAAESLAHLTESYNRVRYGEETPAEREIDETKEAYLVLRKASRER